MHIALRIGADNVLMASDSTGSTKRKFRAGNNFHLSIEAESKEEAKSVFDRLSADGEITMPLGDTFWGAYFGMLTDRFGIRWMVSYTNPSVQ